MAESCPHLNSGRGILSDDCQTICNVWDCVWSG
nr:MAG TPA: hypothetical protein [Caudoviricetes sp.]